MGRASRRPPSSSPPCAPASTVAEGPQPPDPACELCEAARFTHWYHEDERCWVADCEVCAVPMVVWQHHGPEPAPEDVEAMLPVLPAVAPERVGPDGFDLDRTAR